MPAVEHFEFEVVPAGVDESELATATVPFIPFVLEVPSLSGEEFAARRAWWTAFHHLGAAGVDEDQFDVFEFTGEVRGRRVTMGGFEVAA